MCWAPATPSCPGSCAAGCATSRSRPAALSPMRAALSRCRACCARPNIRPGRNCSVSSITARRIARCATTTALNHHSLGDDPRAGSRPRLMALAIDHRAQLENIADEARRAARAHRRLQAARRRGGRQGRRRPARLRRAAGRQIRPRGAVSRRRPRLLDRPAGRGARRAAARFRVRRLARRQIDRMAARPHHQVPVLLSSRRPARDEGRARTASSCACMTRRARSGASC